MAFTRGTLLNKIVGIIGDDSSDFRTYLESCLDNQLYALWDLHDWSFKQKSGQFNTVIGTDSYNLSSIASNFRSSTDIEVIYDTTNTTFLNKEDLRSFKKYNPGEDDTGQPDRYAAWGNKSITLYPKPDGVYSIKLLYTSKPVPPTSDNDDMEDDVGLPDYVHFLFEKMLLAEAFLYHDDVRRVALLNEIQSMWLRIAVQADMKQLETTARFKFWEEELAAQGGTYNDFLKYIYDNGN